ncbi:hypothetical protein EKK58_08615 [Candidatus Dependentiae bacterium]|nr:MAG: hypothetical protein EKK58_08615 [Candidatus Dependentiae bacterium]
MGKPKSNGLSKTGRPRIEINWDEMAKLMSIQATLREVAGWFECSEDTIERACLRDQGLTFAEYSVQKRQSGKISLRRKQFEVALKGDGNVSMLIWLGKQYLEQGENTPPEDEVLEFNLPEFLNLDGKEES